MDTYDYVIVGAGSAGSVLANRLSEDGTATVLVLEAGPSDWHPFIHLPAGFIKTFHNRRVNWLYSMEPSEWTGGRRILAPRGKTLGGSSSINGHVYNRGQRMDFDTWAQLGNRGWGYADVLPYFKRMERRLSDGQTDPTFRGRDGALTVTDIDWFHPLCEAFIAGAVSLGIPRNPDYNGTIQEGIAYAQRTIHKGRRVSAATSFLHPARKRVNVTVRTAAHVTELLFEGKRAVGVAYSIGGRGGEAMTVRAAREVILSGGTYNSPAAAAALRHRSACGAAGARHCRPPRAGRRRREPARSLRAALHRTRQEHRHHQRARARPAGSPAKSCAGPPPARASSPSAPRSSTASGAPIRMWRTRTCNSPSRRRATRKACRASSTPSPA